MQWPPRNRSASVPQLLQKPRPHASKAGSPQRHDPRRPKPPEVTANYARRMQNMRISSDEMPGYQQFPTFILMRRTAGTRFPTLTGSAPNDDEIPCNHSAMAVSRMARHQHDQGSPIQQNLQLVHYRLT